MIKSSEDANKYYNLVNQYVDEYVDKWKIKPTNLKNYLLGNKSRLVNFLERKGLSDINNIDRVISDVIEDRVAMYNDGVMTFENFKLFESDEYKVQYLHQCIYKGISNPTINHEKFLADFYDVSLSEISLLPPQERHSFFVSGQNSPIKIYSNDEISIITENILDYSFNQTFNKEISLDLGKNDFKIKLSEFLTEQSFKDKFKLIITRENVIEIISELTLSKRETKIDDEYQIFIFVGSDDED